MLIATWSSVAGCGSPARPAECVRLFLRRYGRGARPRRLSPISSTQALGGELLGRANGVVRCGEPAIGKAVGRDVQRIAISLGSRRLIDLPLAVSRASRARW